MRNGGVAVLHVHRLASPVSASRACGVQPCSLAPVLRASWSFRDCCALVCAGEGLEEESKVGQETLTGAAEDEQSGPRILSLPNQVPVAMFQGLGVHVGE